MDHGLGSLPVEPTPKGSPLWSCLGGVLLTLGLFVGLAAAILVPGFLEAREQGWLNRCKSNLKNLATSLEMYASDNGGRYPVTTQHLVPRYLKVLPTCPASHVGYNDYQRSTLPDQFSFSCVGNNHSKAYQVFSASSDNLPAYYSEKGLIDHPP